MTTVSAQHSANIIPAQWDAIHERVQAFHPDETYTLRNSEFVAQFLVDGHLSLDSHFAFTMIRDELSMLIPFESVADLVPFFASPLTFRKNVFLNFMAPLARNLVTRQESMPLENLSDSQSLFRFMEIHENSIPLTLLIDIGWCLGFRQQPRSNSWHLAGKSYLLGEMCRNVFEGMHPDAGDELVNFNRASLPREDDYDVMLGEPEIEEVADVVGQEQDADTVTIDTFVANSTAASQLKLIVMHVWHQKCSAGACWSVSNMKKEWLMEALVLFRSLMNKSYAAACFPAIANTAENTWISGLVALGKMSDGAPAGEWSDTLHGTTAARKKWLIYYAALLVKRKTEPPRIAKRLSVGGGTSASSAQRRNVRQATEANVQAARTARAAEHIEPTTATAGAALNGMFGAHARFSQSQEEDRAIMRQAVEQDRLRHEQLMSGLRSLSEAMVNAVREMRQPQPSAHVYATPAPTYRLMNQPY